MEDADSLEKHAAVIEKAREAGLLFPVTVIDGEAVYDGAVSYPAILRQVETRLSGVS